MEESRKIRVADLSVITKFKKNQINNEKVMPEYLKFPYTVHTCYNEVLRTKLIANY